MHGPRLTGEILPGGTDWQIVRPDGTIEVVARYTIRADMGRSDNGALIYVQNDGLRVAIAINASWSRPVPSEKLPTPPPPC